MDTYPSRVDESRVAGDLYRRRSPGKPMNSTGARRNGRGRSRSPQNIDRYQPDRQRDDHYRNRDDIHRRRSSPAPIQAGIDRYVPGQDIAPSITQNPMPNPINLDYQVGFNFFAEWWRVDQAIREEKDRQKNGGRRAERVKGDKESREERGKEREQIQAAYDAYKEKLQVKMAGDFVRQHKGEEWFKERYEPAIRDPFRQQLKTFRQGSYEQWEHDLAAGEFDNLTLEGIYKSESNGAGGVLEKEEGEMTAATEVLGPGDLLPTPGGEVKDEASQQPTLLIKTIAPTVSRAKMEEFCKEHLGDGAGGFKWLSLSDPNPLKRYHRIGWVVLRPGDESPADDGDKVMGDGEDGAIESEPPPAPVGTAAKAVPELNGKTIHDEERGDFTCHVGIHDPQPAPRKKALWDLFSAPERIDRDLHLAMRLAEKFDEELGTDYNGLSKIEDRVEDLRNQGRLQPQPEPVPKKEPESDDMEDGEEEETGDAYDDDMDDEELLAKKKKLDLLVEYLRRVFNFCFFCVFESDSVHELLRKCPGGHLRRPRSSLTTAAKSAAKASAAGEPFPLKKQESNVDNDGDGSPEEKKFNRNNKTQGQLQKAFNWVRTYEDKLLQILDPESVDIKKIGGKPAEEALEDELSKYVKQEDESKFRCKVPECTKLFKGQTFWRKHVEKRHEEFYQKLKHEVDLINAYVLDPAHIAPSRTDANSNGHFPNHHQPAGTPRGFSLNQLQMNFGQGMPNPAAFQAFLAQSGAGNNWAGPGGDDDRHGVGPMRRGGGRFTNTRGNNPYDRQTKDSRNMRWNAGNTGRLTPPRIGQRGNNPRYAEGGVATVGPREAVQGRSLKSYEDLDAVGGNTNGALDY
ncbi:hypothetical protein EJ05DRAFT_467054 [Pseudovirgaria hyperparasitica]|uniref:C2H2-type domain-containing protein n=1 Tax=Pseudovirgaria hyperparasitica TaxID=470096 RepID=A0A6A6W3Q6_9PEZI|nr:uncharacterized protein EJ05DRAFT_467054 [Pseudovirgaria hyperparasitica]KAF2756654.1 hypothetical protein EJ05DRAFT_467054 [Pseudovirgaria hyperparasitica]